MSSSNNHSESNTIPLNYLIKKSPRKSISQDKKIPKNIGSYELKEKIVDGSYCKIYLGKSKYIGDKVAIKVIDKTYFLENMEDLLLIKRQIEILKIIKHRNILTLYEIYESLDFIFIVTEYIPGKNLCEMIVTKRRFKEEEAQKIFVQIVDALFYLHSMNICHRNITSNHILFDFNNTPKLIGFSYSTFYDKKQELKDSFGSLCHACPEIISESPYKAELSDTWSLGTVLYTMVAGYLPFSEENDEKNKELIILGKVEYPKEMSNKLKDLLTHMMDPNPKKRYNLDKIMKHPWFKPYNQLIGGCNHLKMSFPVDYKILNIIEKLGFDKEKVELDLKNNKFNKGTGLYKLLVKKANISKYHSVSDFGSKEFLDYRDDKKNYITDGDIQYEKYLQEVQRKIELVEKSISNFQEKEENIIKELNNLEESLKNESKENSKKEEKIESSAKNEKRKSTKRKSPEQKSNIIQDINDNNENKLKKIKSCSNFPNVKNALISINQSISKKNNNILNKPRRTHFSNNAESWHDTSIFIKKRKSYLNNSTFFESLLKKTHPDNIKKSEAKKNIINNINQVVIIEEKAENNKEKKKSLRFSISFSDEDNDAGSSESDDNISKVDSRQLSMFDEDGIKLMKELKMLRSSYQYKGKKKSESIKNNNNKNQEDKRNNGNQSVSKFMDFEEEKNGEDKKEKEELNIIEKKEENDIENIYSTIKSKSDNNEIKKGVVNEQIMEIKKIDEIIIPSKSKEISKPVEIITFYNDKKNLIKLDINNSLTEDFCSIKSINRKFEEGNILSYYNDTKTIKKIKFIDNDNSFPIILKANNDKEEELNVSKVNKEQNEINLNSSCNSNEEIINKENEIKKNSLKPNKEENKLDSESSSLKNNNKYAKSMNSQKNKIKDKIKLVKKSKMKKNIKYKSDICHSKYNEDLSFINISGISEIKPSSTKSPSYANTNIENKENIITNNNYLDNKSFQSKSQISNLSMTHENNIFLGNVSTLNTYHFNNYYECDLNNFYMVHLDNFSKNTYNQNHILNIKKRNLAQKLKEEIQKSIEKKQIKSSLLMSTNSNSINNRKISNKKTQSTKQIFINNNYYKNTLPVRTSKLNRKANCNSTKSKKNTIKTIKNKIPEYVNFIKIRQNKMNNSICQEKIIKSNGKSVENVKEKNNKVKMNKSKNKKKEISFPDKFIFCSSVRNFNNYCCFNMKHRRDYENCSTDKHKENKSTSRRYCDCDKKKINKEIDNIKSNGKKINSSKEKIQKEQNCNTYRSYLNIYEHDKKFKLNREKMKNGKNNKITRVIYPYKNIIKQCRYDYRRIFLKINA